MFKVLDKFGGEVSANEQAIFNKISTNNSSGYVNGYLNSLGISKLTSNAIGIDSGLLSIQGFRFVNDTLQTYTVSVTPSQPIPFQLVAVFSHYVSSENDTLSIITRPIESLRQENLYGGSNAVYELELARFTMTADGITDFTATLEQLTYNDQDINEILQLAENADNKATNAIAAVNKLEKKIKKVPNTQTFVRYPSTWEKKTWNGLTSFDSSTIWTDGNDIYCSRNAGPEQGIKHYVLNKATSTWEPKTWSGTSISDTSSIWTDGENIYYSNDSAGMNIQLVLNKETNTWEKKVWNINHLDGIFIWTDGEDIYYSGGYDTQLVLDKAAGSWHFIVWNGLLTPDRRNIWTDGNNVYYSSGSEHYVLNKEHVSWDYKAWNGLTSFFGSYIWTDGENIYYSSDTEHYVLNKATSTWEPKTWSGLDSFYGSRIWTDGDNVYYDDGYVLKRFIKSTKMLVGS